MIAYIHIFQPQRPVLKLILGHDDAIMKTIELDTPEWDVYIMLCRNSDGPMPSLP